MSRLEKHYTATVYILSDGHPRKALLLHHRKHGVWNPPGGHQEANENPLETAVREVREETGLDIAAFMPKPVPAAKDSQYLPLPYRLLETRVLAHGDELPHYHLDVEYLVIIPEQAVVHDTAESHDIGWFTVGELDRLELFDDVRAVLKEELAK